MGHADCEPQVIVVVTMCSGWHDNKRLLQIKLYKKQNSIKTQAA